MRTTYSVAIEELLQQQLKNSKNQFSNGIFLINIFVFHNGNIITLGNLLQNEI